MKRIRAGPVGVEWGKDERELRKGVMNSDVRSERKG